MARKKERETSLFNFLTGAYGREVLAVRKKDGKSCRHCGFVNEKKVKFCDRCDQSISQEKDLRAVEAGTPVEEVEKWKVKEVRFK